MGAVGVLKGLRSPAVVAAFSGWNDAGEAASGVIDHLVDRYQAEVLVELDPEKFYDFQVNRPATRLITPTERTIEWPTTEVLLARLADRDLILIGGPEPNFRWRRYVRRLMGLIARVRPEMVVVLGALLTDAPHTRPVPVIGTVSSPELAEELGLEISDYEGPTGIVGVLASECATAGLAVVSLWASVPHYVGEAPNPNATLALLTRLEDVLNTTLDTADLPEQARDWVEQVNELVADDAEIATYVSALEERRDEATPQPTGESIAAEFERYLRRRNRRR